MPRKPTYEELEQQIRELEKAEKKNRRAEEAVRASEKGYLNIFMNSHAVMLVIDPVTAEIVDANPAAVSFYGWRKEVLTAKKITDINTMPKASVSKEMEGAKTGQQNQFSFKHRLANGDIRDVEVFSGPIEFHNRQLLFSIIHDITERKQVEKKLIESEETAKALLNATTESAFLIKPDSTLITMNNVTASRLGKNVEDIVGHQAYALLPPEVVQTRKKYIEEAVQDREPKQFYDDRSGIVFENNIYPIVSPNNEVTKIAVYSKDITKQKQAERALLESMNYLDVLFNTTLSGTMVIDAETHQITDVNSTAVEAIGLPKEDIVGQVCHNFVCPAERGKCPIADLGQVVDHSERVLLNGKGEAKSILKTVRSVSLGDKGVYIESFIDISKLKGTEEELRKSDERFRAIFESTNDCILVWDRDYNYLYANRAAIDHVGTTRDQVIGKNMSDGLGHIPDFMHLWMSRVDEVFEKQEMLRVEDAIPVGDVITHSESVLSPIRDADGNIFAVGVVYRDISERKKAEQEREALIGELKSAIAKVNTLSGLLPICSKCKKIRDDKGYWNNLESYLKEHSDVSFSHGICTECADILYGNEEWYKSR